MIERAAVSAEAVGWPDSRTGEWVATLDIESAVDPSVFSAELAVRALAVAVAGSRTYVAARTSGYSFTVIIGTTGAAAALAKALELLAVAQRTAGLDAGAVVCAEVTLVGSRPVPASGVASDGCENPAS
ncbi:hypothetical protein acdb102_20160 [Acidothermaceae bacterium B102]|nr:hypothetical protein acdb102_20160 [Acidothermaceae bacterium B102]